MVKRDDGDEYRTGKVHSDYGKHLIFAYENGSKHDLFGKLFEY